LSVFAESKSLRLGSPFRGGGEKTSFVKLNNVETTLSLSVQSMSAEDTRSCAPNAECIYSWVHLCVAAEAVCLRLPRRPRPSIEKITSIESGPSFCVNSQAGLGGETQHARTPLLSIAIAACCGHLPSSC